jgi:hypothetical protein
LVFLSSFFQVQYFPLISRSQLNFLKKWFYLQKYNFLGYHTTVSSTIFFFEQVSIEESVEQKEQEVRVVGPGEHMLFKGTLV